MKFAVYLVLLFVSVSTPAVGQQAPADLILLDGQIFTADPANPFAEAIAIRGERVLAVGSSEEIKRLAGAGTRSIDLQGRRVIPGINDAHFHFMRDPPGASLQFATQEPSWAETVRAIEQAVRSAAKGEWIFGQIGVEVLSEEWADRFALDRIAPEHPVLLRSYFGHGYIANSQALPLLGIAEEEPDPLGGYFERVGGTRRVNGRFWEYAEWAPDRVLAARVSDAEVIAALEALAGEAVRSGITSMQIMSSLPVDRFARVLVQARLPIRVRAIPFALTTANGRDRSELRALARLRSPSSKVTVSGIKWVLDGTPSERGAALREPYSDRPDWRGRLNFPEREIVRMVRESLKYRQQLLVHCAGDRCAETVLDALENVGGGRVDWQEKRVRIEHGDGVSGELIDRAKRLGVVVVQNPAHFAIDALVHARYSPDTAFFPVRSLLEAGVPFALGSDGPMNPFLNIMFATIHPARPAEAITREQAVIAYTSGAAYAEFAEGEKGTLTAGKLADLAVLSQDVLSVPVPDLPQTASVLTIVGGEIVYEESGSSR